LLEKSIFDWMRLDAGAVWFPLGLLAEPPAQHWLSVYMRIPTIPARDSNLKAATIPIEGGQYWPVGMFMGSQRW